MDIEKAKEISSSINWAEIVSEIDSWIKSEDIKMRTCIPEYLLEHQLVIKTLEKVKTLPQIVVEREE